MIVAMDLLHHLARPARFFEEAARVLAHRGCLAVVEPWVTPFSYPIYRWRDRSKEPMDGDAAVVWRLVRATPVAPLLGLRVHAVWERNAAR